MVNALKNMLPKLLVLARIGTLGVAFNFGGTMASILFALLISNPLFAFFPSSLPALKDNPCLGLFKVDRAVKACGSHFDLVGNPNEPFGSCCELQPLSLTELIDASKPKMSIDLATHLEALSNDVTVRNLNVGGARKSSSPNVSVVAYNLHQYRDSDNVLNLFTSCEAAKKIAKDKNEKSEEFFAQACRVSNADVMLFTELDEGACRSGFRESAAEIATAGHLNYALVNEFVEVDPKMTGLEGSKKCSKNNIKNNEGHIVNATQNGIMSRFPIISAERVALEKCHDWYREEQEPGGLGEPREMRRGNRQAIIARLKLPGSQGILTAVSAHLENKTDGACRKRQMAQILEVLKDEKGPIVIGGDWNTIGGHGGIYKLLAREGFDTSQNDGNPTFEVPFPPLSLRLDHIATKATCPTTHGATLTELKNKAKISDHAGVALDIPLSCK